MSRCILDLTDQKFGRLTAIRIVDKSKYGGMKWLCKCECGAATIVVSSSLHNGLTKSCGCLYFGNQNSLKHGDTKIINGKIIRNKEYRVWDNIKDRCLNPNNKFYKDYGGRGISIYKSWVDSYKEFLKDVGRAPGKEYTIDRINNDGNYEPRNVKWSTWKQQANNRRNNKK